MEEQMGCFVKGAPEVYFNKPFLRRQRVAPRRRILAKEANGKNRKGIIPLTPLGEKEGSMSWSVNGSGTPAEVRGQLSEQFKGPLAEKPAGLSDDGERETVHRIHETIEQVLATFDPEKTVTVSASGHMGFRNWDTKEGPYQNVSLSIGPKKRIMDSSI